VETALCSAPYAETGNRVKRVTSDSDIKEIKYSYSLAKYSLEDQPNPAQRAEFKQKLLKYIRNGKATTNAFTDMVLG
jgi:hypothetical protein